MTRVLLVLGLAVLLMLMIRWLVWYSTSGAYNGGGVWLWSLTNLRPKDSTVTAYARRFKEVVWSREARGVHLPTTAQVLAGEPRTETEARTEARTETPA